MGYAEAELSRILFGVHMIAHFESFYLILSRHFAKHPQKLSGESNKMKLRPQPWNGSYWQRLSEYQNLWLDCSFLWFLFWEARKLNLVLGPLCCSNVATEFICYFFRFLGVILNKSVFWEARRAAGLFVVVKWPLESLPLSWERQPGLSYASFILTSMPHLAH